MDKEKFKKTALLGYKLKRVIFLAFIVIVGFIGILWFARPKTSEIEKRELTKFPKLTISGLLDGSFFTGIDTWYSDTFPLREGLISKYHSLQSHYGIRSSQIIAASPEPEETAGADNTESVPESQTDPDELLREGLGDVNASAEHVGAIYIAGGSGYGIYSYGERNTRRYADIVSSLADKLSGKANVYSLVAPISAGIMLADDVRESIGCDDEGKAIDNIISMMSGSVRSVNVYHALKRHNSEYIFFRTDHHWTSLGAYYSYREFCKVKGIAPHEISDFKTMEFDGFLGTFYQQSNRNSALGNNPDTVTAYIPNDTNNMVFYSKKDGVYSKYEWKVIYDVSSYPKSELYSCFAGSDQPYSYCHNPNITDGSSILVVKDSYGNAFIPFLIDHYEHIHWIDYRYYRSYAVAQGKAANVSSLVEQEGIKDVLLLNNINFTGASKTLDNLSNLYS